MIGTACASHPNPSRECHHVGDSSMGVVMPSLLRGEGQDPRNTFSTTRAARGCSTRPGAHWRHPGHFCHTRNQAPPCLPDSGTRTGESALIAPPRKRWPSEPVAHYCHRVLGGFRYRTLFQFEAHFGHPSRYVTSHRDKGTATNWLVGLSMTSSSILFLPSSKAGVCQGQCPTAIRRASEVGSPEPLATVARLPVHDHRGIVQLYSIPLCLRLQ